MAEDCVACHARATNLTAEETAIVDVSHMIASSLSAEDVRRDMCFAHRRQVEGVVRAMRADRKEPGDG